MAKKKLSLQKPHIMIDSDPASLTQVELEIAAIEMKKAGWNHQMIGAVLNMYESDVRKMIRNVLRKRGRRLLNSATEEVAIENERLEEMIHSIWDQVQNGNPRAIEVAVKVMQRRAELLGLDQPIKTQVDLNVGLGNLTESELRAKAEQLGLSIHTRVPQLDAPLPGEELPLLEDRHEEIEAAQLPDLVNREVPVVEPGPGDPPGSDGTDSVSTGGDSFFG